MKSRLKLTVLLCTTFLAFGCADDAVTPVTPAEQEITRALAMALGDSDVRAQVRDAMRASPFTEHKLVLQDFIKTPNGQHMLDVAARTAGVERVTIEQLISQLPKMDFYMPVREHRLTWRATPDVVLATEFADTPPINGYTTDGRPVRTDFIHSSTPGRAILVMHPAEPKSIRINPQASVPGEVIQELDDGELGGTIITRNSDGSTSVIEMATMAADEPPLSPCPDYDGVGPATYLKGFYINDPLGENGSLELRIKAAKQLSSLEKNIILTGLAPYQQYCVWEHILDAVPDGPFGPNVSVQAWESDATEWFYGDDDYYGGAQLYDASTSRYLNDVWFSPKLNDGTTGLIYLLVRMYG